MANTFASAQDLTQLYQEKKTVVEQLTVASQDRIKWEGTVSQLKTRFHQQQQIEKRAQSVYQKATALAMEDPDFPTDAPKKSFRQAKHNVMLTKKSLNSALLQFNHAKSQERASRSRLSIVDQRIAAIRENVLRKEIEQEQVVTARGEVSCNEDMSVKACKNAALEEAKRQAAERGSAIMIDSLTSIKDAEVVSDEVRSRVHAIVLSYEVLEKGVIGDGIGFFYKIKARVKGQMPRKRPATARQQPSAPRSAAPSATNEASSPTAQPQQFHIKVQVNPSYATVKVLNIKPRYSPQLLLYPGRYRLQVVARGYQTARRWVEIVDRDITAQFSLKPSTAAQVAQHPRSRRAVRGSVCKGKGERYLQRAEEAFSPRKIMHFLELAQEYCPRNPQVHDKLGEMYMKSKPSGYMQKAEREFEMALRLNADDVRAKDGLFSIRQRQQQQQQTQKIIGGIFGAMFQ
ncbi:MAG: hypothetical protein R8J85_09990 [Mariprofundales bacterium]